MPKQVPPVTTQPEVLSKQVLPATTQPEVFPCPDYLQKPLNAQEQQPVPPTTTQPETIREIPKRITIKKKPKLVINPPK